MSVLAALLMMIRTSVRTRAELQLENLALRHQLQVLSRTAGRPQWSPIDKLLWTWLARTWRAWRAPLLIIKPETVIAWHRRGFRAWWTWKSRPSGRPPIATDIRALIRNMADANPRWGAPRIHGELLKLGINVSQAIGAKYMVPRHRQPPSQTWRSFLKNHVGQIVAADFFVVPTGT